VPYACNVPTVWPHVPCYHHPCGYHVPQHITAVHYSILVPQKLRKTLSETVYLGKPLEHIACHELLYLTKVIEDSHSLELLHLAVQAPQWHSWPQLFESLIHELDLLTCGEEHNDLGA